MKEKLEGFKKFDSGKPRWSLFPIDALQAILKVLTFGAEKYEPNNWCRGCDWSRYYNAAMRHLTDWWFKVDRGRGAR